MVAALRRGRNLSWSSTNYVAMLFCLSSRAMCKTDRRLAPVGVCPNSACFPGLSASSSSTSRCDFSSKLWFRMSSGYAVSKKLAAVLDLPHLLSVCALSSLYTFSSSSDSSFSPSSQSITPLLLISIPPPIFIQPFCGLCKLESGVDHLQVWYTMSRAPSFLSPDHPPSI